MSTRVTEPETLLRMAECGAISRDALGGYAGIDVLWAVWDEDSVTHARVVRGRELEERPGLIHGAEAVYDESGAYDLQETFGDPMTVAGDGTWEEVEPAVPPQFRDLIEAPATAAA